ncbi:beta-N-acetylhexosaminidase [Sphingomonas sp. KR1UV-12]|uniref:beta-N-acetylhexosaminidase n=1 Tax=Sphingomonas aurea TaxID=3063994 RepID=A0ABT9EFA2_9SPHN|nr:beta-N-acetylhexosaminidase [Sphingomonas sp. KR1UV-12]MDP1025644.1 beta-N-acetylhexosaminidase [Sphingomonas sp. KR1UV-12]
MTPIVVGIAGPLLSPDERRMLAEVDPAGVILFARNVVDPPQLRALTAALRAATDRADLALLIDQEGGPVARLRPPLWPAFPAASVFADAYARAPMTAIQAARANGEALGHVLAAAGITMNAAPVLDLTHAGADPVLADRTFGSDPLQVAALGRAWVEGMATAGVVAIVKHLPGHGRATVDPHHALPVVTPDAEALAADFAPFRRLSSYAVAGMVGHVVYAAWDPERPASLSPTVIGQVVRDTIGFDGLLLSDDLHMGALSGGMAERAAAAIVVGCDLALCCHATPTDVRAIAARLGPIAPAAAARLARATPSRPDAVVDPGEAIARRDTLLSASNLSVRLAMPGGNA